jgi:hypothetical protein
VQFGGGPRNPIAHRHDPDLNCSLGSVHIEFGPHGLGLQTFFLLSDAKIAFADIKKKKEA